MSRVFYGVLLQMQSINANPHAHLSTHTAVLRIFYAGASVWQLPRRAGSRSISTSSRPRRYSARGSVRAHHVDKATLLGSSARPIHRRAQHSTGIFLVPVARVSFFSNCTIGRGTVVSFWYEQYAPIILCSVWFFYLHVRA